MTPSSQEVESPGNPGRFISFETKAVVYFTSCGNKLLEFFHIEEMAQQGEKRDFTDELPVGREYEDTVVPQRDIEAVVVYKFVRCGQHVNVALVGDVDIVVNVNILSPQKVGIPSNRTSLRGFSFGTSKSPLGSGLTCSHFLPVSSDYACSSFPSISISTALVATRELNRLSPG